MPPTTSEMAAIERSLGAVQGGITSILRELDSLKVERREDVATSNARMDRIEGDISIVGATATQAHDLANSAKAEAAIAKGEAAELKTIIIEEIKPQTDNIKGLRLKTIGFLTAIAFVGGILGNPALAAFSSAIDKFLK